jgi:hypothetical protein
VPAQAAAILNHSAAFGIRIASFDLHRPNAGNACDEIGEEAAFSFGFDGRHGDKSHVFGISRSSPSAGKMIGRSGTQIARFSEAN